MLELLLGRGSELHPRGGFSCKLKATFGSNCAEPWERNDKPLAEIASTGGNTNADYDCTINLEMRTRSYLDFGAGKCLHSGDTPS